MRYISTRGTAPALGFEDVLLTGLATDGGLYVPESLPSFSAAEWARMATLDYPSLALELLLPFVDEAFSREELAAIIHDCYREFRHPAVAPLTQLAHNQWVLELFHGPTLAFKDFALQLLGRLLDAVLARRGERVVVMGATSGDTGSAAIAGCQRCDNIDIFILHPHERVSEVQRRQMTTVLAPQVHNLAVRGNFDDCQDMVKASFRDQSFLPQGRSLVAVNSINWARIMAQIVYYAYAALALGAPSRPVAFSVPTGNFGDIFAGYLASRMGLPVAGLMIATNRNDVLHRLLTSGSYARGELHPTLSPSMDISVSSNLERLLFDLYDRDGAAIARLMADFTAGPVTLVDAALEEARRLFSSFRVDDESTVACITRVHRDCDYLLDPHSAIGVAAAENFDLPADVPRVTLATAHPAKFPAAIERAVPGLVPQLPPHMADLYEREERFTIVDADLGAVQSAMAAALEH